MTHAERDSGQQGSYSRQVFLAVLVINVCVNTERGAPEQKCELSTSIIQAEMGWVGGWWWWWGGIHTMGEKINAICLSHHVFPKYISTFLYPRQKLYWGTLSYCLLVSPSSQLNPQLFISTFLISHARISERSTILINVSCFSALTVQGIIHRRGPWDVQEGFLIGIQKKWP